MFAGLPHVLAYFHKPCTLSRKCRSQEALIQLYMNYTPGMVPYKGNTSIMNKNQ